MCCIIIQHQGNSSLKSGISSIKLAQPINKNVTSHPGNAVRFIFNHFRKVFSEATRCGKFANYHHGSFRRDEKCTKRIYGFNRRDSASTGSLSSHILHNHISNSRCTSWNLLGLKGLLKGSFWKTLPDQIFFYQPDNVCGAALNTSATFLCDVQYLCPISRDYRW